MRSIASYPSSKAYILSRFPFCCCILTPLITIKMGCGGSNLRTQSDAPNEEHELSPIHSSATSQQRYSARRARRQPHISASQQATAPPPWRGTSSPADPSRPQPHFNSPQGHIVALSTQQDAWGTGSLVRNFEHWDSATEFSAPPPQPERRGDLSSLPLRLAELQIQNALGLHQARNGEPRTQTNPHSQTNHGVRTPLQEGQNSAGNVLQQEGRDHQWIGVSPFSRQVSRVQSNRDPQQGQGYRSGSPSRAETPRERLR